jgi:hypothetical protein
MILSKYIWNSVLYPLTRNLFLVNDTYCWLLWKHLKLFFVWSFLFINTSKYLHLLCKINFVKLIFHRQMSIHILWVHHNTCFVHKLFMFVSEIFAVNGNGEIKVAKSIPRNSWMILSKYIWNSVLYPLTRNLFLVNDTYCWLLWKHLKLFFVWSFLFPSW